MNIFSAHTIFLALYPILFTYSKNVTDVRPTHLVIPFLIIALSTYVFSAFASIIYKNLYKSAIITSLGLFLTFSYGHIEDLILIKFGNVNDIILSFSILMIFLIAALKLKQCRDTVAADLNVILNAFALTLIIFPIYNITINEYNSYEESKKLSGIFSEAVIDESKIDVKKLPNIFHICLDEYAREDVLRELYDCDNGEFIKALRQRGFFVADKSRTNYCYTDLSLISTFNMDYLDNMTQKLSITESVDRSAAARKLLFGNAVFKGLKKAGYKIITFNTNETYTSINDSDIYYSPFSGALLNAFYYNMLINMTPAPVALKLLSINAYFFFDPADQHRKAVLYPFEKIDEIKNYEFPYMACLWIDCPHPPFVFDDKGRNIVAMKKGMAEIDRWAIESDEDRLNYRANFRMQLKFISQKVIEMIDKIIAGSKRPPIIILQADHGPASLFEFEKMPGDIITFKERFAILNAYYMPEAITKKPAFYETITPVNTFRIIFNEALKTDFKLLEDKCFHSIWLKPYKYVDVSNKF